MSRDQETTTTTFVRLAQRTFFLLASPKAAVVLLLALAAVLAWATLLEARHGSGYARWFVYESAWLFGLLAMLGLHIFCAAVSRWPWQPRHVGFVVTHAGLLALLVGGIQSFWGGVEGSVLLAEKETTDHVDLTRGDQVTAFWVGWPQEASFEFTFDGGPVDWPPGKSLEIGEVDGVTARVLAYYQHAHPNESWVADKADLVGPAVQFNVTGPAGVQAVEGWLVDQQFGDAVSVGPIRLQLQQAASDCMVEDFLHPSAAELGERGRLTMYFGDAVQRVSLDTCVGQKVALGNTGVAVEITEYLANAVPDRLGRFASKGEQPKNPMVELRVYLPEQEQPLRQIAFAKDPLLNLDGVYPTVCPVKFRFDHAAVQPQAAVELLQTCAGKLLGRLCSAGHYRPQGELRPGDRLDLAGDFHLEIVGHIPHAKRKVTFTPSNSAPSRKIRDQNAPAALVELTVGGKSEQLWLRRNDPAYGRSTLAMPGGIMAVAYECGRVPLGFTLGLTEFRRELKPGNADNTAFSSKVRVVDSPHDFDQQRVISMNQPLTYGNFTFYQSSLDEAAHDRRVSTLMVTHDPGRTLKYCGSVTICLGIAIMFYMRRISLRANEVPRVTVHSRQAVQRLTMSGRNRFCGAPPSW